MSVHEIEEQMDKKREKRACAQAFLTGTARGYIAGIVTGAIIALAFLLCLLLSGCFVTDWIHGKPIPWIDFEETNAVAVVPDVPDVVVPPMDTNEPPEIASTNVATGHEIVSIGAEEVLGSFDGSRPSVAVDSRGTPWVIVDKGTDNTLMLYSKLDGVRYEEIVFAQGSKGGKYNAGRIFLPHLVFDTIGRMWVSAKFGCKEWGSPGGQGLWCPNKFVYSRTKGKGGNANVCITAGNYGLMLCANGAWEVYDPNGNRTSAGTFNIGGSGEKIRGAISQGVIHLAMNGWEKSDSKYINNGMKKAVTWAAYSAYPEMGSDMCHPSVGIDLKNPKACYIGTQFSKGIMANVWNGSKMMFSATNLLCVCDGGYLGTDRWGPQWTPTLDGGAYVCFVKGKRVKMRHVAVNGGVVSVGPVVDVCAGSRASMCTDRNGQIHLVYNQGGMRYRKVRVE